MARTTVVGKLRPNRPDLLLLLAVLLLTSLGVLIVYSASFAIAQREFNSVYYFAMRQLVGALIGLTAMFVLSRINYRHFARWSPLIMLAALVGLALVLIPGVGYNVNGASRWIRLGPLPPMQPSEFAKLAMIIYIAAWLAAKGEHLKTISLGVIPFMLMVGLVGGLIMLQPDMGTFGIILITTSIMFFVAGASLRHLATLGGTILLGGIPLVIIESYRLDRIVYFLHPEKDPDGKGFQILQLLIALGSGGVNGLGLGASRQKFFYVPAAHTDGIFAIIGEEAGFAGGVFVIALFTLLVARGFRTANNARDPFGHLLAVGITCWIGFQAVINIGAITRSLPLTGVPLPFLSYGMSALIALLAGVGVLLSVSRYGRQQPYLDRKRTTARRQPAPLAGRTPKPVAAPRRPVRPVGEPS